MDTDKRHCGYTNYETWAVSLWLRGNDLGNYDYWGKATQEEWDNAKASAAGMTGDALTPREAATLSLAKRMQKEVEDDSPCDSVWLYTTLVKAALDEVNWAEIAENFLKYAEK